MKDITTKDLKESLTLLLSQRTSDGEGGWRETWKKGPVFWASLWPVMGRHGFHGEDVGGALAAHQGYMKSLPPAYYRIVIRRRIDIPLHARFLWHLRQASKRLLLVSSPVLIQCNQFLSMIGVEEKCESF